MAQVPGSERWVQIRSAAGFWSDSALERALGVCPKQIWRWVNRNRDPHLSTLLKMKRLLGVSLDVLAETIVSWRGEVAGELPEGEEAHDDERAGTGKAGSSGHGSPTKPRVPIAGSSVGKGSGIHPSASRGGTQA